MLSIFSCAFWPSVCLLWRNVYLDLLPVFDWVVCFVDIELYLCIHIFWRLIPVSPFIYKYFPLLCRLSFCFVYGFLCWTHSYDKLGAIIWLALTNQDSALEFRLGHALPKLQVLQNKDGGVRHCWLCAWLHNGWIRQYLPARWASGIGSHFKK